MIYNASAYNTEKDSRIRDFLHFVCTNEPGKDSFTNRLSDIVEKLKDNDKFKGDYLAMNLHDRDLIRRTRKEAIEEGFSQGASQKAVEAARNLFANGASIELIAKSLKMSESEIRELTRDIVPEMEQSQSECGM